MQLNWERLGLAIAQTTGKAGQHYIIYLFIGDTPLPDGRLTGDVYQVWRDGAYLPTFYTTLAQAKAAVMAMEDGPTG